MNPIFENKSEITLEKYIEQCSNPVGRKAKKNLKRWRTTQISGMVVMFIITAMAISYKAYPIALVSGLFVLAFIANLTVVQKSRYKQQYNKIVAHYPDGKWIRTISFDKDIKVTDGGQVSSFRYHEFIRMEENNKYYLLYKNENAAFRIEKGAFTVGKEEKFARFIKGKIEKK